MAKSLGYLKDISVLSYSPRIKKIPLACRRNKRNHYQIMIEKMLQFPKQNAPTTLALVRDGKPIAGSGEVAVKELLQGEFGHIEGGISRLGKYSPRVPGGLIQSFEVTVDGQGPMMIIKDLFGLGPKDDLTGDEASGSSAKPAWISPSGRWSTCWETSAPGANTSIGKGQPFSQFAPQRGVRRSSPLHEFSSGGSAAYRSSVWDAARRWAHGSSSGNSESRKDPSDAPR